MKCICPESEVEEIPINLDCPVHRPILERILETAVPVADMKFDPAKERCHKFMFQAYL